MEGIRTPHASFISLAPTASMMWKMLFTDFLLFYPFSSFYCTHTPGRKEETILWSIFCTLYLAKPTSSFTLKHVVTFQVFGALWNNMLKCMNFAGSEGRGWWMCIYVCACVVWSFLNSSYLQYVHQATATKEFGVWKEACPGWFPVRSNRM